MKSFSQFTNYITAVLVVVVITYFSFVGGGALAVRAATSEEPNYSGVLEDLEKDKSFSISNYPFKVEDYSLNVIQIAESADKELFIYVYQPQAGYTASSINLSVSINDNIKYSNYKLKLLNSEETLYKYIVCGFTILSAPTRYYAFTSIYRPFNEDFDKQADHDNKVTEVNYPVNKQYCFSTINGNPYCAVIDIETITVTDKFVGYVRYQGGGHVWGASSCDNHFVAFDTDRRIDKLLEADVYYASQSFHHPSNGNNEFGVKQDSLAELKYTDKVEHSGGGLFAGTYTWDRIETVEQFIAENDLAQNVYAGAVINVSVANKITDEGRNALKGKKWILRFTESSYSKNVLPGSFGTVYTEDSTIVGDVTILRLKFETDGVVYNLGVIDNKQSGSQDPVNDPSEDNYDTDFKNPFIGSGGNSSNCAGSNCAGSGQWLLWIIIAAFIILLILFAKPIIALIPSIIQLLAEVISFIITLITAPFRAISNAIKKKREERDALSEQRDKYKATQKTKRQSGRQNSAEEPGGK